MRYLGIAGIFQFYKVRLKRFLNTNKKAASIISILQSSIKTPSRPASTWRRSIFQFYKVRLKQFTFGDFSVEVSFQFYKVRLKPRTGEAAHGVVRFQFYKVRLKQIRRHGEGQGWSRFQLYKVRLKRSAVTVRAAANWFQIYKVRLKPSRCRPRAWNS